MKNGEKMLAQKNKRRKVFLFFAIKYFLIVIFVIFAFGCDQYLPVVSHYDDPSRAYNGYTYFQESLIYSSLFCIDMEGTVVWEYSVPFGALGVGAGFEILDDGTLLASLGKGPAIIDPGTDTVLWEDTEHKGHHSITKTTRESVLILVQEVFYVENLGPFENCQLKGDFIREIDLATHQIIWEWHLKDYVDPAVHYLDEAICETGTDDFSPRGDWSHCNTVKYYPGYELNGQIYNSILLNSRQLDTLFMIDHATGNILLSVGQHGMFGGREPPEEPLFHHAHEVSMLENGNYLMYDNRNLLPPFRSRALEIAVDPIAQTAEEVWSWTQPPEKKMYDTWGGDANRLPNGNTLIVNSGKGRITEVEPNGEKVWEMEMYHPLLGGTGLHQLYKAERVPYDGTFGK